jgi:hypothetical protein
VGVGGQPVAGHRTATPPTLQWGSLGATEDRIRVTRSLGEAVTAMVVWEALDEADRVETLGKWARLLP